MFNKKMVSMMKNFLKSTVSTAALLGAIFAFTPLHAMKEEDVKEQFENYSQRKVPQELIQILTPLKEEDLTFRIFEVDKENYKYDPQNPFTTQPKPITQMILGHLEDAPSFLAAQKVCKLWRTLSFENYQKRLHQWASGTEDEELLKIITSSPQNLFLALQELGKNKALRPFLIDFYKNPNLDSQPLNKLAVALKEDPILHSHFCRRALNHVDVLDIPATSIVVYLVKQVQEIEKMLTEIKEILKIDPAHFPELVKDFENHPRLKQYLMALKFLALKNDGTVYSESYALVDPIQKLLNPTLNEPYDLHRKNVAHLIGHPFWGAYTFFFDNVSSYQWQAILGYFYDPYSHIGATGSYGQDLDPNDLKTLWEYSSTLNKEYIKYQKK